MTSVILASVLKSLPLVPFDPVFESQRGTTQSTPRGKNNGTSRTCRSRTDLTLTEITTEQLGHPHHEAFFRVSTGMEVTAWTLWFGLQYNCGSIEDGATVGNGALATVR